ncbi:hypothetical protein BD779DRAFT_1678394 [Infundibulicybe gibba]|nr:hypothetical protein BD779DRAFT_1678394 [Infundibulicybe gibba]
MESLLDGTHFVMEAMTLNGPGHVAPSNTFVTRNGPNQPLILAPPDRIAVERQGWKAESKDGKFYIVSISGHGGFSWEGDTPHSFVILDEPKPFSRPTLVPDVKPPIGPVGWLQPIVTHHIGVEYYVGRNESSDKLQFHSYPVAPPFTKDKTVWKLIPMAM